VRQENVPAFRPDGTGLRSSRSNHLLLAVGLTGIAARRDAASANWVALASMMRQTGIIRRNLCPRQRPVQRPVDESTHRASLVSRKKRPIAPRLWIAGEPLLKESRPGAARQFTLAPTFMRHPEDATGSDPINSLNTIYFTQTSERLRWCTTSYASRDRSLSGSAIT